jgi:hypothetical protein
MIYPQFKEAEGVTGSGKSCYNIDEIELTQREKNTEGAG